MINHNDQFEELMQMNFKQSKLSSPLEFKIDNIQLILTKLADNSLKIIMNKKLETLNLKELVVQNVEQFNIEIIKNDETKNGSDNIKINLNSENKIENDLNYEIIINKKLKTPKNDNLLLQTVECINIDDASKSVTKYEKKINNCKGYKVQNDKNKIQIDSRIIEHQIISQSNYSNEKMKKLMKNLNQIKTSTKEFLLKKEEWYEICSEYHSNSTYYHVSPRYWVKDLLNRIYVFLGFLDTTISD